MSSLMSLITGRKKSVLGEKVVKSQISTYAINPCDEENTRPDLSGYMYVCAWPYSHLQFCQGKCLFSLYFLDFQLLGQL